MPLEYRERLGARLRAVRTDQGLSLKAVEEKSAGRWKSVVIGSYERGDRRVTVDKLVELAEFYGVPVASLVPEAGAPDEDMAEVGHLTRVVTAAGINSGPQAQRVALAVLAAGYSREALAADALAANAVAAMVDVLLSDTPEAEIARAALRTEGAA